MDAIVLAGGFGTRLRPWTLSVPKPLVPLLDTTLIEHSMRIIPRSLVNRVIIAAGYEAEQIRSYFTNLDAGVEVVIVEEKEPLGTGGAIANCLAAVRGNRFLVLNGDLITTVDIRKMIAQHERDNRLATISLWPVENPNRFGVADFDSPNRSIKRFQEKPDPGKEYSNLINAGCYLLEREVIDQMPDGPHSIEREVFPSIAKSGNMGGFCYTGRFIDAGTPSSYLDAMRTAISDGSFYRGKVLGTTWSMSDGVDSSTADYSAIGQGCTIGQNTVVKSSAILDGASIGSNCHIERCLIGKGAEIGDNVRMIDQVVAFN
ncbi:MAG: hypothetical protein CMB75_02340 [Euryarchaeota archaeon]|nr:hypothetical protein [Euryarchaeota archaeon]|tara:strand:- start:1371 stop:2321 length:951 start_codon:yes stop_codon:yes gene_type:complete